MYAVVATGGKQYKVTEGQTISVERLAEAGSDVELRPVLIVDGSNVLSTPEQLAKASVSGKVIEEFRGKKINAFTYKPKTNQRRRWGHRQTLAKVEITKIKGS